MKKLLFSLFMVLTMGCSGCYLKSYPVTARIAEDSTFKVFNEDGQGTAWAVDEHHLVTAGHMCEAFNENFVVVSNLERRFHAKSVLWEKSDTNGNADLCVLETSASLDHPMVIADRMPKVGELIGFVGYPLGKFAAEDGLFLGDLDGEGTLNDNIFTGHCDHGGSGSAVYTPRGVWGVLVRLRTDGGFVHNGLDGCAAISLTQLRDLLNSAGVHYVLTPDEPPMPPEPNGLGD